MKPANFPARKLMRKLRADFRYTKSDEQLAREYEVLLNNAREHKSKKHRGA